MVSIETSQKTLKHKSKHNDIKESTSQDLWKTLLSNGLYESTVFDNQDYDAICREFNKLDKLRPETSHPRKLDFLIKIGIQRETFNPKNKIEEEIPQRTRDQIWKAKRLVGIPTFIHRANSKEMNYRDENLIDELKLLEQNGIKWTMCINWKYIHTLYERTHIKNRTKRRIEKAKKISKLWIIINTYDHEEIDKRTMPMINLAHQEIIKWKSKEIEIGDEETYKKFKIKAKNAQN